MSTSTVERALRCRGLLLPVGYRADRKPWAVIRRHDHPDRAWTGRLLTAVRLLGLQDLRADRADRADRGDRGELDLVDETTGELLRTVPHPSPS